MCFSSPSTPAPEPLPAPPPLAESASQLQTAAAMTDRERQRLMATQGQQSTILTSPLGIPQAPGMPAGVPPLGVGAPKTLLGQ